MVSLRYLVLGCALGGLAAADWTLQLWDEDGTLIKTFTEADGISDRTPRAAAEMRFTSTANERLSFKFQGARPFKHEWDSDDDRVLFPRSASHYKIIS